MTASADGTRGGSLDFRLLPFAEERNCFACSAGGRGGNRGDGSSVSLGSLESCLEGRGRPLEAGDGREILRTVFTPDAGRIGVGRRGDFACSFRGGRGGSSVSPHAGASKRVAVFSTGVARVSLLVPVPVVEGADKILEAADSVEGIRVNGREGDRGGKAGGGWLEFLRAGSGGGGLLAGFV